MKMTAKRKVLTTVLLATMIVVGKATYPQTQLFTKEFWIWLFFLLLATIVIAGLSGERQMELFDHIDLDNFNQAPIFGILSLPMLVSIIALICIGVKSFIIDAIK